MRGSPPGTPQLFQTNLSTVYQTTKRRITQTTVHNIPQTLQCNFIMQNISQKFSWNHPNGGMKCRRIRQTCVLWPIPKTPAQTPYRRKFVSIRQGGRCPRRCPGGRIKNMQCHQHLTVMLVEIWWSQLLSSWHQQGWLYTDTVVCCKVINDETFDKSTHKTQLNFIVTYLQLNSWIAKSLHNSLGL